MLDIVDIIDTASEKLLTLDIPECPCWSNNDIVIMI